MTSSLTTSKHQELESKSSQRHLCFTLGKEHFSIPLLQVKEVIGVPEFTRIPYIPHYFCGMMNLRGKVISVIDLRKKFGITSRGLEDNCVIVCDFGEIIIGVLVDSVDMVMSVRDVDLMTKPPSETSVKTDYINGFIHHKENLYVYLNLVKALSVEDLVTIQKASEPTITEPTA
jgi:purine-binding chemotaxis protein CheW